MSFYAPQLLSEFFNLMLYGNFCEAETAEFILTDEMVDQIAGFIAWLYTGQFPIQLKLEIEIKKPPTDEKVDGKAKKSDADQDSSAKNKPLTKKDCDDEIYAISLWVMGDKFIRPRFTNYVMKYIMRTIEYRCYSSWDAEFVYNNTVTNSKIRMLYEDLIVTDGPLQSNRYVNAGHQSSEHDRWYFFWPKVVVSLKKLF
jgi:hypothetical protein